MNAEEKHIKIRGWFNIKMSSYQCRNCNNKDEMVSWPSNLYNRNLCTDKMVSLYWISPQEISLPVLTHSGQVTHICISKLTIIGSDNGLLPGRRHSHYLNQCWDIVNWTFGNKIQWQFNHNSNIFIQENGVCEMASILSRPWCVKRCQSNNLQCLQWW